MSFLLIPCSLLVPSSSDQGERPESCFRNPEVCGVPERLRPDGLNLHAKLNKAIPTAEDNLHTAIQLVDGSTAQTLNPTTKLASLDLRELELLLVTTPPSWAYKRRGSEEEGSSTKRLKFSRGMSAAFVTIIPC